MSAATPSKSRTTRNMTPDYARAGTAPADRLIRRRPEGQRT
jgi:hypothetical protein